MKYIKLFEEFSTDKYLSIKPLPIEQVKNTHSMSNIYRKGFIIYVDDKDKLMTLINYTRDNGVTDNLDYFKKTIENIKSQPKAFKVFVNRAGDLRSDLTSDRGILGGFKDEDDMIAYYASTVKIAILKFDEYFKEDPRYSGYHAGKRYGI